MLSGHGPIGGLLLYLVILVIAVILLLVLAAGASSMSGESFVWPWEALPGTQFSR